VVIADLTVAKARILLWALLLFQYIELTLIGCQYIEMSPRWRQELGQQECQKTGWIDAEGPSA